MDRSRLKEALSVIKSRTQPLAASTNEFPLTMTPAYETFHTRLSKKRAEKKFEKDVQLGDYIFARVTRVDAAGAHMRLLCFAQRIKRDLKWLNITVAAPVSALENRVGTGDYVKVVVTDVEHRDLGVEIVTTRVAEKDLPDYFRQGLALKDDETFADFVESKRQRLDRCVESEWALPSASSSSFLFSQSTPSFSAFEQCEPASVLRKRQEQSVARRSVEKGAQAIRDRDLALAHRHLAYAISVWPDCVDAYGNEGKLDEAVKELETALEKDPNHVNGRNYLMEILLMRGKKRFEAGSLDEAREDAKRSLEVKDDKRAEKLLHDVNAAIEKTRVVITIEEEKSEEDLRKERDRQKELDAERERKARIDRQKLRDLEKFIEDLKKQ